jgi:hypothetical protein
MSSKDGSQSRMSRVASWFLCLGIVILVIHQYKSSYSCSSTRLSAGWCTSRPKSPRTICPTCKELLLHVCTAGLYTLRWLCAHFTWEALIVKSSTSAVSVQPQLSQSQIGIGLSEKACCIISFLK